MSSDKQGIPVRRYFDFRSTNTYVQRCPVSFPIVIFCIHVKTVDIITNLPCNNSVYRDLDRMGSLFEMWAYV